MNILVTGGAGYVGSIVAEELVKKGHKVIVLDNLQQGHREAVPSGAELIVADIHQDKVLGEVFRQGRIEAVMHMAAETVIQYSMTSPERYFRNNTVGGINLLDAMLKYNVLKLIFSSTAAVYGKPQSIPIEEDHPKIPVNAYGESKLMFETLLGWYGKAHGLRYISLRYFNAAGASHHLGEDHHPETHLIPNILKAALNKNGGVTIFGTDYPTRDGSCIRDYVHVVDIARAHILALEKVEDLSGRAYNLGSGEGYSVLEVIAAARDVTNDELPTRILPSRVGDPPVLIANSDRTQAELGWQPESSGLESIIKSASKWMKEHPNGYER